jgi:hypothetical protein
MIFIKLFLLVPKACSRDSNPHQSDGYTWESIKKMNKSMDISVCNYADRPKSKCRFITPSRGLILTCRRKIYSINTTVNLM